MPETKIVGYKKMFGLVLPDWVDEKTIRLGAAGLLSVAVMLMVLIFFVWPNEDVIEARAADLQKRRSDLAELKTSKSGVEAMQSQITPKEKDLILSAIPRLYSPENAIYILRNISNDSGVSITSYSLPSGVLLDSSPAVVVPGANRNKDMMDFTKFPIRITVSAPVDSLLDFIAKVESTLPFGVVSDLNLQEVTKLSNIDSGKSVQLLLEIVYHQASLRTVDLSKIHPFSEMDIALAKSLVRYNTFDSQTFDTDSITVPIDGSGNVFGF